MKGRDLIIFLSAEFFCFGLLTLFHKWFLSPNLAGMEQYFKDFEIAAYLGILLPFLFGVSLILYLNYQNDMQKKYISLSIIPVLILISYLFLKDSMRDAHNFLEGYIFYLIPLGLLWGVVYYIHCQLDKRLP